MSFIAKNQPETINRPTVEYKYNGESEVQNQWSQCSEIVACKPPRRTGATPGIRKLGGTGKNLTSILPFLSSAPLLSPY